jgi:hypothetical protein
MPYDINYIVIDSASTGLASLVRRDDFDTRSD